jgi:glyoxylase-like metal-dependent hydrolase (beta-lactamase superfamily II)
VDTPLISSHGRGPRSLGYLSDLSRRGARPAAQRARLAACARVALAASLAASLLVGAGACSTLPAVQEATGGVLLGTLDASDSMILLAPTGAGPILIDLGWVGAEDVLIRALDAGGWDPDDVAAVFLTHAHRDHIGGWRAVADAPFYLARDEVALLTGMEPPPGPLDGFADRIRGADRPSPGELTLRPFAADTAVALAGDTVFAFPLPGHTRGSAAYLFRGVLFIGDAAAPSLLGGLRPPARAYSYDAEAGVAALARLLRRPDVEARARFVCTAHARCYSFDRARASVERVR